MFKNLFSWFFKFEPVQKNPYAPVVSYYPNGNIKSVSFGGFKRYLKDKFNITMNHDLATKMYKLRDKDFIDGKTTIVINDDNGKPVNLVLSRSNKIPPIL